jgi:hypothetical protein
MSAEENFTIAQAFLYFKKGCPVTSDEMIKATLAKHKIALTEKQPTRVTLRQEGPVRPPFKVDLIPYPLPGDVSDLFYQYLQTAYQQRLDEQWSYTSSAEEFWNFECKIEKRVREVCDAVFKRYRHPTRWWMPSTNASYETKRIDGGAITNCNIFSSHDDTEGSFEWVQKPRLLKEEDFQNTVLTPE